MAHRKPRPTIRAENERALLEAAEKIFAEQGFAGATTAAIARRAGVPKANLHYYFATKEALYRAVVERVLTAWLDAAASFDASEDPRAALSAYIGAKMDLARAMPLASRIWSAEIMRGAPIIQDFLDTTLTEWVASRESGGQALDRRRQAEADRAQGALLHDLGDDPAIRQRGARDGDPERRRPARRRRLRARQAPGDRDDPRRGGGVMQRAHGSDLAGAERLRGEFPGYREKNREFRTIWPSCAETV